MPEGKVIAISTGTILKFFAVVLILAFLWFVRDVVAIVIVSVLLAALIDPFADWFQKHRIPRGIAVLVIYVVLLLLLALVSILIVPPFVEQITALVTNFGYADQVGAYLEQIRAFAVEQEFGNLSEFSGAFNQVLATLSGFVGAIVATVLVLVLTFYMVVEEKAARSFFKSVAPKKSEPHLAKLLAKMQNKVGAWLRGQIVLGLIVGVASYVGLTLLGVKYALVLAIIAGLFEIVPYIGPTVAAIPAVVLAFIQDPFKGVLVLILYIAIQQLENNILVPKIMQKVTGLNPIISIVALLVGVKVAGIVGAILAVPVAAMIAVLLEDVMIDEKFWKNL